MYKQLDLFNKSQPTDLQALEDTVSLQYYDDITSHGASDIRMPFRQTPQHFSQSDWDLQSAWESGDTQRYQELLTIKHDMN